MKVPDAVIKIKDIELMDWMDYVQTILNNGLYQFRLLTTEPSFVSNEGESAIFYDATNRKFFVYINGVWCQIGWNALGIIGLVDSDADTGVYVEYTADEDVIRCYANSVYALSINSTFTAVAASYKVVFDGLTGTNYLTYSSADSYMQVYSDGALRMEL